ncbi:MAG: DNA-binding protein [Methylotenera sp.]|uniref:DNA-binding protein n=1 Tax=Methylotenera sp. TaxID=2051956 RepID=UPI0017C77EBA|nr:DNA-binding protein [Methylotenera sp.]NOU26251.1 DNA-binding protein [Methylotenera sp.]
MSTTESTIIQQYGILLSFKDCAALLGRSSEGLRVTLSRDSELARKLKPAKIKIGRRVLFRASALAKLLDEA